MTTRSVNNVDIKKVNRNRLYRYIHAHNGMSRQDLVSNVQMSFPTIIQNVKSLIEAGLVSETGSLESTGGRKAATLAVTSDARLAFGVDITSSHTAVVLVDMNGNVVDGKRFDLGFTHSDTFVDGLADGVQSLIKNANVDPDKILGAGVSFPGILYPDGTGGTTHILNPREYSFDRISNALNMHCLYTNDANAAAVSETWKDRTLSNFAYLSLGITVGGAIILNGTPLIGDNQRCGELGHITIDRDGPRCYCGRRGCVFSYCSSTLLSGSTENDLGLFFERLRAGDATLCQIWDDYLDYLATAVNTLRMVLDFDVILGGYVGAFMDEHITSFQSRVATQTTFPETGLYVKACQSKVEASAVGAALMHIENFIRSI